MHRLNALAFRGTALAAPFQSILYPDDVLLSILQHPAGTDADIQAQAEAFAELLVRCHFKPKNLESYRISLEHHASAEAFTEFLARCETSCTQPDFGSVFAPFCSLPLPFQTAVERRFRAILSADGFIPVFQVESDGAFLLPFSFRDGPARIEDWDGEEIPEWTAALAGIPEPNRPEKTVRVAIQQKSFGFSLIGDSLGLPVLMGWWRHIGELPRYPAARLLATGAFHDGRLVSVRTEEKRTFIMRHVQNGLLLHPADGSDSVPWARPLSIDLETNSVLDRIRPIAEERHATDGNYSAKRLETFALEIQNTVAGHWAAIVQRLLNLLDNLNPQLYPEECLRYRLILSAAYCHAGMTAQALEENHSLQKQLREQGGDLYPSLRLAVEELVALQDAEDWERILELVPGLEQSIQKYASQHDSDRKALDLAMRFHGTLGQAHAYGTLAGIEAFSKDASRRHLDQAVEFAVRLFGMARKDKDATEQDLRIRDVAQDDNYLHRWDTLFAPEHAPASFLTAWDAIQQIQDAGSREGNRHFLLAYQAFGAYHRILEGHRPQPLLQEPFYDDLLQNDSTGYLAAMTAKYLGACEAANGNAETAADYFTTAVGRTFPSGGVLDKIRMTIHAEAYRSLRSFPEFAGKAEEYRDTALRFIKKSKYETPADLPWKEFLNNPDSAPFPGLSYWY